MNNPKLKLLILEDSLSDMELTVWHLREARYQLDVTHAEDEQGFREALQNKSFDVIISDFKLPGFDAFGALEICQQTCPEVPFICVSGIIGEETAVELIKKGAIDYVLKDRPARLPFSVQRALAEAKEKHELHSAEEKLKKSEERFNLVMNASSDGLFDWNLETNEIYYSPGWKKMIGYEDYELPNDFSVWEITTSPEDVKKSWELQQKVITKQIDRFVMEFKMKHKDGHWVDILSRAEAIFNNSGKAVRIVGTHTDITERKQAEEALKESEKQFRLFTENTMDTIWSTDQNFNIIFVNNAIVHFLGYTPDEFINSNPRLFTPENGLKAIQDAAENLISEYKQGNITQQKFELKQIRKDGKVIDVEITANLLFNDKSEFIGFQGRSVDITERKQAESELIKLSTAVQQSPSVIAITDTKGKLEYVNPQFTESTGYSMEEAIGQNPRVLKSGEQSDELYKELWKIVSSGKVWHGEFHNKKKNGELYWELASVSPIFDQQGKIVNYLKVAEDITERKQAEYNFKHSIDESPLGIRIVNQEGKTIYVNKALLNIYEFSSPDEFLNTSTIETYTEQSYQKHQERKKIRQQSGDVYDYEISIRRKNGEIRHVKVWRKEVIWNREKHFQVINQDITELKQLNNDLIQAKEKAEESDKLKTAFIQNISHEIRTPLNGILGFAELIAESDLSEEERLVYLEHINQSSNRLMNTVSDYMDMARIVSNSIEVNKKVFALEPFFVSVTKKTKQACSDKKLKFEIKLPINTSSLTVNSDPAFIQIILNKLLDNAVKFTKEGSITCGYCIKNGSIDFFVQDTGSGIDNNKLDLIFEMFRQADPSLTRGHEGSGLGLTIAMSFVTLLGGEIKVTSEKGKGSVFSFTIPLNNSAKSVTLDETITSTSVSTNKPLILIAEDEESNYEYLKIVLKVIGVKYIHAFNGAEAVAVCEQNTDISLVLMDIKMPVMRGDEATRQIRKFRPELPIIAITAFAQTGDEQRFRAAGCNDYVAKPIKKEKLMALLSKYGV